MTRGELSETHNTGSSVLRRLMAWFAFIGILAVIAVAIISDELANQTVNI